MFESATLTAAPASTRLWSTCAGISGQVLIVGCMLLAPLISPAVLPNLRSYVTIAAPPPPPPPPVGEVLVRPHSAVNRIPLQFRETGLVLPRFIPPTVAKIDEPPEIGSGSGFVVGGMGIPGGAINGVVGSVLSQVSTPPPPIRRVVEQAPSKPPAPTAPIRVRAAGGNVHLAAPIFHPDPIYPAIARNSRVEGVVELEGIIGTDGRIHNLKVLKGHPFLVKAAVDAVMTWVYKPATLNGDLVEVIAPITVTFHLAGR
jgi:periplasmic protein TonB